MGFGFWVFIDIHFFLWIVAKLLCFYLCPFDAIVQLHAMDENCSISFSLESASGIYM
jgi:hypothetical protein